MYIAKKCPIENTFEHIGKKWSVNIIRDLLMGKTKFKEFLKNSPDMSAKMLSQRLKELEKSGLIEKIITSKTPIKVDYNLTEKGKELDKLFYEFAMFSMKHYTKDVLSNPPDKFDEKVGSVTAKKNLGMK